VSAAQAWLEAALAEHGAFAGTVHVRHADELLHLVAAVNIPEIVQAAVRTVPLGKGMAGLAWARGVPVQTCNLQTDETGDIRPGARAVDAQAAVALPVTGDGTEVRAVVGFAFREERALAPALLTALAARAATLPA
jgi:L-methionine (R)-S-oxide reductase